MGQEPPKTTQINTHSRTINRGGESKKPYLPYKHVAGQGENIHVCLHANPRGVYIFKIQSLKIFCISYIVCYN